MKNKQELLTELRTAFENGTLSRSDIESVTNDVVVTPDQQSTTLNHSLSTVDIMFYIGGIVLYAAICMTISQSWNTTSSVIHIGLSAGIGLILWLIALFLIRRPSMSDIQSGMTQALLLTGSLTVSTGGFIAMYEITKSWNEGQFIAAGVTLFVLSLLHVLYDRAVHRDLILLIGIVLGAAAIPAMISQLLSNYHTPLYAWCLVAAASAGLLAYVTRVISKLLPTRSHIAHVFDGLSVFIALGSLYVASRGDNAAILWLILLIAAILGIFYLSIIRRNKYFLGNASLFLIITIITIAFEYFSGFGIATSLLVAATGLLGTAAAASVVNKKYIRS